MKNARKNTLHSTIDTLRQLPPAPPITEAQTEDAFLRMQQQNLQDRSLQKDWANPLPDQPLVDQPLAAWQLPFWTGPAPSSERAGSRLLAYWPLAAVILLGLGLSTPPGRLLAEVLWRSITLARVENIQLDLQRATPNLLLPNVFPFRPANQVKRVLAESPAVASALAGFAVRQLPPLRLPNPIRITVAEEPELRHTVALAGIQEDLQRLGRPMPTLPAGIDGAEIRILPNGKSVTTAYGECPELVGPWKACALVVQSRLPVLQLPPALSPDAYVRFSLELAGFSPQEASRLAQFHARQPTFFLPTETAAQLRPVTVRGAQGTLLIYPPAASGETAFVVQWVEDGFHFQIFGRNPDTAIALATSLQ